MDHFDSAKVLLELGADVNRIDEVTGNTPLRWAADLGNYRMMKLFLESGANPNLPNKKGITVVDRMFSDGNFSVDTIGKECIDLLSKQAT